MVSARSCHHRRTCTAGRPPPKGAEPPASSRPLVRAGTSREFQGDRSRKPKWPEPQWLRAEVAGTNMRPLQDARQSTTQAKSLPSSRLTPLRPFRRCRARRSALQSTSTIFLHGPAHASRRRSQEAASPNRAQPTAKAPSRQGWGPSGLSSPLWVLAIPRMLLETTPGFSRHPCMRRRLSSGARDGRALAGSRRPLCHVGEDHGRQSREVGHCPHLCVHS